MGILAFGIPFVALFLLGMYIGRKLGFGNYGGEQFGLQRKDK